MTVVELRELLEEIDDDVEVKVAWQPHYPMESPVAAVTHHVTDDKSVVYVAASGSSDYAPSSAWDGN